MKKLITLSIAILFVSNSVFTQSKLDYDHDSKWFLGFNFGGTWHTTDVNYKLQTGYGYGLTLGKSFNYNYGKKISFDIRGRYLRGTWYGQDTKTSMISPSYSGPLSDSLSDYKTIGFTVNNFKTDLHRVALELVIHANGIRERSGWDPYIFGGIGVTWHQTFSDLINTNDAVSSIYPYDNSVSYTSTSIKSILDKNYETSLDGNTKNTFTTSYMPSLGFGLGYQVSKHVSIGLEHKSTFTGADNFDGVVKVGKYKQDIYHYTSGYIRFQLRSHRNEETITHVNPVVVPVVPPTPIAQLPVVKYITPAVTKTTVTSPNYLLQADVNNVIGRENIVFKQEGVSNTNFTYNATTDRLESNVVLKLGENTFEITGTNTVGFDVESTIVIYKRESGTPPVVTITNPNSTSVSVSNPVFSLTSTVLNVQNASQITFKLNGQNITNFQFNALTNGVNSTLNLINGENTVVITGVNTFGTDSKTVKINYTKPTILAPPIVHFVIPNTTPFTSPTQNTTINATVLNVASKSGIEVTLNNSVSITNFTFTPSTNLVSFPLSLNEGSNSITITGTNASGVDSKTQVIIYRKPVAVVPPPVVTFVSPNATPYTSTTPSYNVTATVLNVLATSGIVVKLNGNYITNFTFVPTTSLVSFPVSLVEGSNSISITGTNASGVDSKTQTIIYNKPVVVIPPVVTFVNPLSSGLFVTEESFSMVATVLNVDNISQITLSKDGQLINNSAYTFDVNSKKVTFNTGLLVGNNVFSVTGTNTGGTDNKTTIVVFRKAVAAVPPPVVTFVSPNATPYTSTTPSYNVTATVLNVLATSGIVVKLNGNYITNFTFVPTTSLVSFPVSLVEGSNSIIITGTNASGVDSKTQTIIYNKPVVVVPPPVVTFVSPNATPYTSTTPSYNVNATVLNVLASSGIVVKLNGNYITNFTFVPTTSLVSFPVSLVEGTNSIIITGTNASGVDSKTQTIIYNKPVVVIPPVVTFVNPLSSGLFVTEESFSMVATVLNVDNISQITLTKDGQTINNSSYTFDSNTKKVTFNTGLLVGNNVFSVKGTNTGGTDTKNTIVIFRKPPPPCLAPEATIINPAQSNMVVNSNGYVFSATFQNITSLSQVVFKLNNVIETGGTFNADTKLFSKSVVLAEGSNILSVILTNDCGNGKAETTVKYIKVEAPCNNPSLNVTSASDVNNAVTSKAFFTLSGVTSEINNDTQITVTHNSNALAFTYDVNSHVLDLNDRLPAGLNVFVITLKNNCGTKVYTYNITYKKVIDAPELLPSAPTMILLNPVSSPANAGAGLLNVKGKISNVNQTSIITITVNDVIVPNFNPVITNNELNYNFNLNVVAGVPLNKIVVSATNPSGNKTETYIVNYLAPVGRVIPPKVIVPVEEPAPVVKPGTPVRKG